MAAAFHKSSHRSNVCAKQSAFLNFVGQRGNNNFTCFGFEVFACPMLSDNIEFFRQRNLLDNMPVVQRNQTVKVSAAKLVFDNMVNLIGGKRLSRMFFMPRLTAVFSFLVVLFCMFVFGLTMSDEGGLAELLESFLSRATSSSSC